MNWFVFLGVWALMLILHPEVEPGDRYVRRFALTAVTCAIPAVLIGLGLRSV